MSIISVKDVSYKYRDDAADAVRNVSFEVDEGEFVAVLGSNGSGKSTLAKLINALFVPTQGAVTVCGIDTRDEAKAWDVRAACGMVFQNPDNQLVATIVEEDVAFGLENMGVEPKEIRRRVDEALAAVGMSAFSESAPHMLSGGQKQRVAIAGALAMQTKCLVLDEPTAMLDPQGRADILACVKKLHEERGITIVYITHFMEEAAAADRIVVMDQGHIVTQGTPHEIFSQTAAMRKLGLEVPVAAELAAELRQHGVHLPASIITAEELAAALSGEV